MSNTMTTIDLGLDDNKPKTPNAINELVIEKYDFPNMSIDQLEDVFEQYVDEKIELYSKNYVDLNLAERQRLDVVSSVEHGLLEAALGKRYGKGPIQWRQGRGRVIDMNNEEIEEMFDELSGEMPVLSNHILTLGDLVENYRRNEYEQALYKRHKYLQC